MKENKVLIIIFLGLILLAYFTSCKKQSPCELGDTCAVNKHIFNDGVFQPTHPLIADSINHKYTQEWGITYFDMNETWKEGDSTRHREWNFPQEDLHSISQ